MNMKSLSILQLWSPSRWSTRMRQDSVFPMDANGRIRVPVSGVYFIYAQVGKRLEVLEVSFSCWKMRNMTANLNPRLITWTNTT